MKKLIFLAPIIFWAGCITSTNEKGEKTYSVDPNVAAKAELTAEAGITLVQALGLIWPALLPVATAGAGVIATYKKIKPKLTEATNEAETYYKAGEVLSTALEEIKTQQPEIWAKVAPELEKYISASHNIENAIRGFRHLAPKE